MNKDVFRFRLHDSVHATEDDLDYMFTAKFNGEVYTVSFQGESVDFSLAEVDQYINEGFWELV